MKESLKKERSVLGENIQNYINNRKLNKDKTYKSYGQSDLAKEIYDVIIKDGNDRLKAEEQILQTKTISKWINGDAFPKTKYLIALSKIIGVSVDDLLEINMDYKQKSYNLTEDEKKTLKLLLNEAYEKNNNVYTSAYFYYNKNNNVLLKDKLYTLKELEEIYRNNAKEAFMFEKRLDFYSIIKNYAKEEKIFSTDKLEEIYNKFCSVEFLPLDLAEEAGIPFDTSYDNPNSLIYSNKEDYYYKLQSLREISHFDNVYNFCFYEEVEFGKDAEKKDDLTQIFDEFNFSLENRCLNFERYKILFKKYFDSLIEHGIISLNDETIDEKSDFENDDTIFHWKNDYVRFNIRDVDGEYVSQIYELEAIKVNFKLNLSKDEIQKLII